MKCFEDLKARGLIYDSIGDLKGTLNGGPIHFYVGIDPTGDGSGLHVGHLISLIVCKHLQKFGHVPHIILGGATSALGDPSGKESERPEISLEQIATNTVKIKAQVQHILGTEVDILNNNDWMSKLTFVDFMREMGKAITVNQMLAKSSVKSRIERQQGISVQEFNYMLVQGFDFLHMWRNHKCVLEMGGQDQWSNIQLGCEAIRKKENAEAMGLTWPLIIDPTTGRKFGKTEGGKNIWLDGSLTTPYTMYQFFLNLSDEQSEDLIKKFTLLSLEELNSLIEEHKKAPHMRILQKKLAEEVTTMVHSKEATAKAKAASEVLYGKADYTMLKSLDVDTFHMAFDGVQTFAIDAAKLEDGPKFVDIVVESGAFKSKGEVRNLIKSNGISLNKIKFTNCDMHISKADLIHGSLVVQKGKTYMLVKAN